MKLRESQETLVTLANASELVANIAQAVVGNDIADTFDGSPLTRAVLHDLSMTKFQAALSKQLGA